MTDKRQMKKMLAVRITRDWTEHCTYNTINGHMALNTMNEHEHDDKKERRKMPNKNLMKEKSTSLLEFIVVSCKSYAQQTNRLYCASAKIERKKTQSF